MTQLTNICPACSSAEYSLSHEIRGYTYFLCSTCGMLYLNHGERAPKLSGKYYDSDYFSLTVKDSLSGYMDYRNQSYPLRKNFRSLLSRISRHISLDESKSLLDVGCAYGFFLDEARRIGLSVHGLDLSESAIHWMEKELGIKGTVGLSSDAPMGPFDLITATEVIEHVSDLHSFINDLHERMMEEGILVIHTGAHDTLTARLLGKRWWYLNPPDHCSIFSRYALRKLVSDNGFNILEHYLTPYYWVGFNNMLLKLARICESRQLARIASKMPAFVIPVSHYSTQLLIARKR